MVVDLHGGKMKINQVANISVVNNKMLSVNVWDIKSVGAVKDAISQKAQILS